MSLTDFRDKLACPACRSPVVPQADSLGCVACSRVYPIRDGVPVMMDEGSRDEIGAHVGVAENARTRAWLARMPPWLYGAALRVRPPHPFLFTHGRESRARFSECVEALAAEPWVLDIGAGISSKGNIDSISESVAQRLIAMDIGPSPLANVIGDAHKLPFLSGCLQGVLIQGVLEHVRDSMLVVAEITRVLGPGGMVYCVVPFLQHYHQDPEDFRRYTHAGLRQLFSEFEEVEAGVAAGPTSALCDILTEYPAVWFESPLAYWGVKWILGWLVLPLRQADRLAARRPRARLLAGALYFMGRKRG